MGPKDRISRKAVETPPVAPLSSVHLSCVQKTESAERRLRPACRGMRISLSSTGSGPKDRISRKAVETPPLLGKSIRHCLVQKTESAERRLRRQALNKLCVEFNLVVQKTESAERRLRRAHGQKARLHLGLCVQKTESAERRLRLFLSAASAIA